MKTSPRWKMAGRFGAQRREGLADADRALDDSGDADRGRGRHRQGRVQPLGDGEGCGRLGNGLARNGACPGVEAREQGAPDVKGSSSGLVGSIGCSMVKT